MQLNNLLISISDNKLITILKKVRGIAEKLTGGVQGTLGKIPKFELTEKVKEESIKSGLYHFVKDDYIADTIIESGYLRPSDNITSYGRKSAFMFCGGPSIDNYTKNLISSSKINPYISPTIVTTAIKFRVQEKDLANYKFRGLQDGCFSYEGYCILSKDAIQKVKMVPDLVRDFNGVPVKNDDGEYDVAFRVALPEELSKDKNTYMAKQDYLQYMKKKAIEYGYLRKNGKPKTKLETKITTYKDIFRMENDVSRENIDKNMLDISYSIIDRLKGIFSKKTNIEKSAEECLKDFSFKNKNPYRDKSFALAVADFQSKEGLRQLDLNDVLPDFTQSKEGEFFYNKYSKIESSITKTGIHGKGHTNRVSLLAMIIASNEEIFKNDDNNRIKDILVTSAIYHDIGRILYVGPHSNHSAKKVAKMDLRYLDGKLYSKEDKKMVMALIESHEGKPSKIDKMIKKYKIQDENNINLLRDLNAVVRDADALDRVRLDFNSLFNYKVDLNPKFLVNDTSKMLINASYQLEFLTKRVPNVNNILNFGKKESKTKQKEKKFHNEMKVDNIPVINKEFIEINNNSRQLNNKSNR